MKNQIAFLATLLALFMLCSLFVGCDLFDFTGQTTEEDSKQELFKDLKFEDTFEDGKPYHLYFISNGDGTCALKYVTMDPEYEQGFVIEIPEKSPAGDIVTSIDTAMSSGFSFIDANKDEPLPLVPYIVGAERFEALCQTAIDNCIDDFSYKKFTAFFLRLTLDDLDPQGQEDLLDAYPIVACGDVYVFDTNASQTDKIRINGYLRTYCEWDLAKYKQIMQDIMDMVKKSDTLEQAEASLSTMRYSTPSKVVGITIPKTVTSVDGKLWWHLDNLQTITVDENNPSLKMVDGCLVNTDTGVLEICLNKDGAIPENAGITTIEDYSLVYFDPQFPSPEAEDISVCLTIPEGVTHMEYSGHDLSCYWDDDDPSNDYIVTRGKIRISLPKSLESINAISLRSGYCYEYAGTIQEWYDCVECYHDAYESQTILVKAADQADYVGIEVLPKQE